MRARRVMRFQSSKALLVSVRLLLVVVALLLLIQATQDGSILARLLGYASDLTFCVLALGCIARTR